MVADPDYATLLTYTEDHPNRILLAPGAAIVQISGPVDDAAIRAVLPLPYP